ncbi:hypothetical protein OJ253_3706 [Cryptosporidium canis]|uniref:Uncharacterized protein n=1 Tax=Cryptosporidium canis TaxID=195482 RepID=A0A9D5DEQ5_9CRYT|nr:hypothetical protein OJ253_3706 [Cryptosporidium canis]
MTENRLQYLFERFRSNAVSEEELQELLAAAAQAENEEKFKLLLTQTLEAAPGKEYNQAYWNIFFEQLMEKRRAKVIPLYKRPVFRWIVAASVILVAALSYFVISNERSEEKSNRTVVSLPSDVEAPKETRAVITLADSRKIYLDSAGNGVVFFFIEKYILVGRHLYPQI